MTKNKSNPRGRSLKPKSVFSKKGQTKSKYKADHHGHGGLPIEKSVYNYKTKAKDTGTESDWSEDDFDYGNENCGSRSEQLRESHPSDGSPLFSPPLKEILELVSGNKSELPRSPAVDALAELLGNRDKKIRLLSPNIASTSSSSEEPDTTMDIFTSTLIQGGNKKMDAEDISVISKRESVDGGVSIESDYSDSDLASASTSVLESEGTKVVQETVDVDVADKDVEPMKLQGDARNQSAIKELREYDDKDNIEHKADENGKLHSTEDVDDDEFLADKLDFQENLNYERSRENVVDIINTELSSLSPPESDRGSVQTSSSKVVSEDTSGEIFSAVVHKNQVSVMVPYREHAYTPNSLKGKKLNRKKLKLAHPTKVPVSSSFHIFSPDEYYHDKSGSERLFDDFLEEGDVSRDLFD